MKKNEWVTVREAAKTVGCSPQTIYSRIKEEKPDCKMDAGYRVVRRSWVAGLRVGHKHSTQKAQIEGLKTQLAAAEHERDGGIVLFNSLREQLQAAKKDRDEAVASRNNWAQRRCGTPPTIIDRLVAAVDSAPLETLAQIDKPRHAALRRVVSLWSAVDHALVMFTQPGDSAQTTNDDDEVT